MTLAPGSHGAWSGSLGEAIESALAGEMYALREALLPSAGKEDREMLFGAIAQGVLQYLARHRDDVTVTVAFGQTQTEIYEVDLAVPTLSVSGATLNGAGWPSGTPVTLRELDGGGVVGTAFVASDGTFAHSAFGVGAGGTVIDARDGSGHAAQAVLP